MVSVSAAIECAVCRQGSGAMLPYLTRRKVRVTAEDLAKILQYDDVELPAEFKLLDERTQQAMAESGERPEPSAYFQKRCSLLIETLLVSVFNGIICIEP